MTIEYTDGRLNIDRSQRKSDNMTSGQQEANAALAALAASGNAFALGQLWEINKGLLRSMFWKWYPANKAVADAHGLTVDDFEQEGYFAVQYAAEHYDPAKGSFSVWLWQAMQRQIQHTLTGGHRRNIISPDGKAHTISADPLNHCTSLDVPLDTEDEGAATMGDLQADPDAAGEMQDVEERIYTEELHSALEEALSKLTEREERVIRGQYYQGKSVRQICQETGLTRGQAANARNAAFVKLRRNPRLLRWHDEVIQTHAWRGTGFEAWAADGSVEERAVEHLENLLECLDSPGREVMRKEQ